MSLNKSVICLGRSKNKLNELKEMMENKNFKKFIIVEKDLANF